VTLHRRDSRTLTPAEIDEIWALTDRYVEADRPYFERTLRELPQTVVARTRTGELVGVVSLEVYPVRHRGRTSWVIFTANVVIDEPYRRRGILERAGVAAFLRVKRRHPFGRVFWLFDTFSFKSYLLLPRNAGEYWPRKDRPTPAPVREFVDVLATARYGSAWDPARGVVIRSGRKRLRPRTAPIDERMLSDPDIRFYDSANPGHREGDMLVCLCPLTLRNWLHLTYSNLRRLTRRKR
jgi:hypothetical protein